MDRPHARHPAFVTVLGAIALGAAIYPGSGKALEGAVDGAARATGFVIKELADASRTMRVQPADPNMDRSKVDSSNAKQFSLGDLARELVTSHPNP